MRTSNRNSFLLAMIVGLVVAPAAPAGMLEIEVTNNQPAGGLSFTPVWFGVHDGTFDLFDPASPVSPEIEAIAELGNAGPLNTAFAGQGDSTVLVSPAGAPPFTPGETATGTLHVMSPSTNRYLSFASMIVPSNDLFIANPNPTAIELFDALGSFLGTRTINVFARMIWDAGTEVNDLDEGAAFVQGVDATMGGAEGGVATLFFDVAGSAEYLSSFQGRTTADGGVVTHLPTSDELIATITIRAVPEPSAFVMVGLGLAVAGFTRGLRRRSA